MVAIAQHGDGRKHVACLDVGEALPIVDECLVANVGQMERGGLYGSPPMPQGQVEVEPHLVQPVGVLVHVPLPFGNQLAAKLLCVYRGKVQAAHEYNNKSLHNDDDCNVFVAPAASAAGARQGRFFRTIAFQHAKLHYSPRCCNTQNRYFTLTQGAAGAPKGIAGYDETRTEAKCRKKRWQELKKRCGKGGKDLKKA